MRTAALLAQAQLRRGWKSLVGLSLLIALVGGLVLAGFAGAQRTRTAVDRMIDRTEASDVSINPDQGDESVLDFDQIAALPMVEDFSRMHGVAIFLPGTFDSVEEMYAGPFTAAHDGELLRAFDRPVMIDGRVPDPDSLDEVYIDRTYADSAGLGVGELLSFRVIPLEELTPAFMAFGEGDIDGGLALVNDPDLGSIVDLTVSGIGTNLEGVAVDEGYEPVGVWMGPALYRALGEPTAGYGGATVRLTSPDQLGAFKAAVDAMAPDELVVYQTQDVTRAKALRATQPAAVALGIFAVVALVLGLLIVGQAISRRFQLDARDNVTLAAIGTTRGQRMLASLVRLGIAAVVGVGFGVLLAASLSLFTPVGPAEFADPNSGFDLDVPIVIGGALALLCLVMLVGVVPAWHGARHVDDRSAVRGSAVAGWLAARGFSPGLTTGVRFGLEPGRGATAVPTRATIIGAVTAITVAAATIVFASSLDQVVNDGRFYGSNFDVALDFESDEPLDAATVGTIVSTVAADDSIAAIGQMIITEIDVDGEAVTSLAFSSEGDVANARDRSAVDPTIAAGRAPVAAGEVALGLTTMRELGVGVGDHVTLDVNGVESDAEVVGRAVLPGVGLYQGSDRTSIGVGALIAPEVLGPRTEETKSFIVVELETGTDQAAFEERMVDQLAPFGTVIFQDEGRPSDVDGLARLRSLPVTLAVLLVLLVGMTVVHALVIAVRRRRRDIAILQALGSTTRSVTAIGAWQGVTIGAAGLLFGVPLGVVAGRWIWMLLANEFGTLAQPVVPLGGVSAMVVGVLVLAAVAGVVPVRRGLRHHPASVLRSE